MSAPSARPAPEASSGSQPGPVPVLLVRAAHPRQAVITALAMAVAAAASGRSLREVGLVGNRWGRSGVLSWLPWAVSFALYPSYLSYGGWGGDAHGDPPTIAMTALAAALGVGAHVLTSLSGLVDDRAAGRRHLPLRL